MPEQFFERELKFKADEIKLTKFKLLMQSFSPNKLVEVSSYDHYLTNKKDEFIRFRQSKDNSELTIKRKLNENNNIQRTEVNLPIASDNLELVKAFSKLLNYEENFTIFKSCWIYYFDKVDIVFYIVFNEDMKELGRFIEIECLENLQLTEEESLDTLKEWEQRLAPLGITSLNRMKKSMYELYKQ